MMITLAIPVYNVEKFVRESLLSALNQTYHDLEILIVDDKSTDRSMDIVRDTIAQHPRKDIVRIIDHRVNKGLGDTRNTSIEEARGQYIFFMDSDDLITPDCIQRLATYMKEKPVDFIASSRELRSFEGKLIAEDVYQPALVDEKTELAVARFRYVQSNKILGEVWNKLYDVDFLRKNNVQCLPGVHVEDVSFSFQVNLAATSCRLVPDITYIYRVYEGQSFAAFRNNRDRAVYLSECFMKIKKYNLNLIRNFHKDPIYVFLLIGIYSVSFLHSEMIFESIQLTRKEKDYYLKELIDYPLSLFKIIKTHKSLKKQFTIWFLSNCPTFIRNLIYKKITKYKYDYEYN